MPGVGGIHIGLGGGGGAGTPVPLTISGLVAWYDAAKGITKDGSNRVSAWANQVAGDANTNLAQATGGNQPLWAASDANLNGLPSVTFTEARGDFMATGTWTTPIAAGASLTTFGIGRVAALSTAENVLHDSSVGRAILGFNSTRKPQMYGGAAIAGSVAITAPVKFALCGVYDASGRLYHTAATPVATGNPGLTFDKSSFRLGQAVAAGTYNLGGQVTEFLIFNRAISQAEVEALLTWAGAKYGITIGS